MANKKHSELSSLIDREREKMQGPQDVFIERVTIEKFRAIWNDSNVHYSDEQLYKIRDWLYTLCRVALSIADKNFPHECKVIELNSTSCQNIEHTENFIDPFNYKRTG